MKDKDIIEPKPDHVKIFARKNILLKHDEKVVLWIYRWFKNNWKFIAGVIITGLIMGYLR